jgi:hypothetical protein
MNILSSKGENTIRQWTFKLNSALATAENRHLKGLPLKVKMRVIKRHVLEAATTELI